MQRLPVSATIREAYSFTFAHLGAIIGLIWLPMVLLTVGDFFVTHYAAAQMAAGFDNNAALAQLLFLPLQILLYAVMLVPVTELALGQRQGGAMIHFGLGRPEWRMFRALLGLMMLVLAAGVILAALLGGLAAGATISARAGVGQLVLLLLVGGLVYIQVRFVTLLLPLVVTEEKSLLQRSWTLTNGNFWPLLAVLLGTLLPPLLLMAMAMGAVLRPSLDPAAQPSVEAVNAAMAANLPLVMGLEFFVAPLLIGLSVGASVFSFRALTRTDVSA